MNRQQVFNQAAATLIAQGVRSSNGVKCLYRGPNGTKCAIGALIPDDQYDPMMEAHGGLCSNAPVRKVLRGIYPEITDSDFDFLQSLQGCHDSTITSRTLAERLGQFAADHGLAAP